MPAFSRRRRAAVSVAARAASGRKGQGAGEVVFRRRTAAPLTVHLDPLKVVGLEVPVLQPATMKRAVDGASARPPGGSGVQTAAPSGVPSRQYRSVCAGRRCLVWPEKDGTTMATYSDAPTSLWTEGVCPAPWSSRADGSLSSPAMLDPVGYRARGPGALPAPRWASVGSAAGPLGCVTVCVVQLRGFAKGAHNPKVFKM